MFENQVDILQVDWAEYNRRQRVGAIAFVQTQALRTHIACLTACSGPHAALLASLLNLGSIKFAKKRFVSLSTEAPTSAVLECARGRLTADFFTKAADLLVQVFSGVLHPDPISQIL